MTINQALVFAAKKLSTTTTSSALDAEVLVMFVLAVSREYLLTNPDRNLTAPQVQMFRSLVAKACKRMPIAYLTGSKYFSNLEFTVNKHVLIPRPDTELLVQKVLETVRQKKKLKILDIGTGSGTIIITLAHRLKNKHLYFASDISKKALEVALGNTKKYNLNIHFKQSSLLKAWDENFDIITANLPYLAEKTILTKYEPTLALVAKNRGLRLIQNLLMQIKKSKFTPQTIFLEIGHNQKLDVKKLAAIYLPVYNFKCFVDLLGYDRVVVLSRSKPA